MEGRFPHAVRLIATNCTDPARDHEFNEWYDRVHTPEVLRSGMVSRGIRYRNADPEKSGPGYLAIHELMWADLTEVAEHVKRMRARLTAERHFPPMVEIVRTESWQRIGPEFVSARTGRAPVEGIFVIESRCTELQREGTFNAWYDETHIPDLLGTGLFVTGYRFAAVAAGAMPPAPNRGAYLAIYETEGDPLAAVEEFARTHRPRLKAADRLSDIIEVTWRGIYRQVFSYH